METHGGSSGGGGASLTISTLRPCTPEVAIWYETSSVICLRSKDEDRTLFDEESLTYI
jgi:hypothetical protein